MPTLDELIDVRKQKLEALQKRGINPYPIESNRKHTVAQSVALDGKQVATAGRIVSMRGHGKILFVDLQDQSGKIQVVFKADTLAAEQFSLLEFIDLGDFVGVGGLVGKTQAGEISIFADEVRLLAKALRPLPDQWHGLKDVEERYRKRYLDMIMNPEVRNRLMVRSKVVNAIRDYLTEREFLEVETPTLQPVYGGGFAKPFVTHHNALDADFYLRISDEMYLKRLIVGGFEKVFEITKVFRNEGIDHDHNPEFTMFEAQIAYEDYRYGMEIIEDIIEYAANQVLGTTEVMYQGTPISMKRPWKRYRLVDAVKEFTGIDPLSWKTLEQAKEEVQKMEIKPQKFESLSKMRTIGEVIAFAFEETVEEKLIQPTIIYDYPIEISPLAKKSEDPRFTQRFEMFAFGSELGNNYTELNDPIDLRNRFVEEKKREEAGFDEAHQTDYDYLEAIEQGFPPTCGIAIGIDRLVMMFTDAKSIKEVIAFPTLKPESHTVVGSKANTLGPIQLEGDPGITKQQAADMLETHVHNENLKRHCHAVGYVMRALAEKLGGDPDVWEAMGILHDADWEETKDDPNLHTVKTLEWLKEKGITEGPIVHALMSHNREHTKLAELDGLMEWALETCDELTGFIVAVTLVRPEKKLEAVNVESVMKKWKQREFAAAVKREQIAQCEDKLGIPLAEFLMIALTAMQSHASELGL